MTERETPRLTRAILESDERSWKCMKIGIWIGAVLGLFAGLFVAIAVIMFIGPVLEIIWRFGL